MSSGCKTQDQHTKINRFATYRSMDNENKIKNSNYNSIKENKILRCNFNK